MVVAAQHEENRNWAQLVECELSQRKAEGYDVKVSALPRVSDWESWRAFITALDASPKLGREGEALETLEAIRGARRSAEHRYALVPVAQLEESLRGGWYGMCTGLSREGLDLTLGALQVLESQGAQFDTQAIAEAWAKINWDEPLTSADAFAGTGLLRGGWSVDEAARLNPYRESASIMARSVLFGLVLPGRPSFAAELAWRDARLTRAGDGLYGAMFAAATCATAYVAEDVEEALLVGVSETPDTSRLNGAVRAALRSYRQGAGAEEALRVAVATEGTNRVGSASAVDAAALIALSLLYGEGDVRRTLDFADAWCAERTRLTQSVKAVSAAILGVKVAKARSALSSNVTGFDGVTLEDVGARILRIALAINPSLKE